MTRISHPLLAFLLICGVLCSIGTSNSTFILDPSPADSTKASIHFKDALNAKSAGNLEIANAKYALAASEYRQQGLWLRVYDCEFSIGQNLMDQGNIVLAGSQLEKVLRLTQDHKDIFDHGHKSKINYTLGINQYYQRNYTEALEFYNRSLTHFQKKTPPDTLRIGRVYNNMGIIYSDRRDFDKTLDYYQRALEIFQKQNHISLISAIYNNIGTIYIRKHDYTKALEYYNRSLDLKLNSLGEDHIDISLAYNNLGAVYQESGENDQAQMYYQKALENRVNNLGPDHPQVALIKRNLGIVYLTDKQYQRALDEFESCLPIWINNLDANHPEVAVLYDHMGSTYIDMQQYQKALTQFQAAVPIWKQNFGNKDPDLALSYRNMGNAYAKLGLWEKSLQSYDSSILALSSGFETMAISKDSLVDFSLSKPELLATLQQKAASLVDSSYANESPQQLLIQIDSVYGLCLTVIDKMILEFHAEGSKLQLSEKTDQLIGKAIDNKIRLFEVTADAKYKTQAFLLAEKNKSGRLREGLSELDAKRYSGVPAELIEKEKQLNLDLAHHQRELRSQYLSNTDSQSISKTKNLVFQTSLEKEQLLGQLAADYPRYHQYKYQNANLQSADFDLTTLPAETTILEYYQGKDSLYFFLTQKDKIDYQKIPIPENFEAKITALLEGLRSKHFVKYTDNAFDLYQIIMEPVLAKLKSGNFKNTRKLVVIPDGFISYIPFETLIRQPAKDKGYADLDYLLRYYQISYHYSADLLMAAKPTASVRHSFLGFAPTFVDADNAPNLALNERTRSFVDSMPSLPNARQEVMTIADILGGKAEIGINATESNFKRMASEYSILHLASHSIIEDEAPLYSKLLFDNEADSIDDGFLHIYELYNMSLNADLVTLSACNTGVGKLYKGEGMVSLARGFMYAGVPNLVMSLWSVSDRPTKDLMTYFYQEMSSGKTKAESLHEAKIRYLAEADNNTANPYYWGSFIYLGQVDESAPSWSNWMIWLVSLAGLVILLLVGSRLRRHFLS